MNFGRKPKPRQSKRELQNEVNKSMRGLELLSGKSFGMDLSHVEAKERVKSDIPSEHIEQRNFVVWFRREFPNVRIFAIPNGGSRGQIEAGRLRAEGVESGVPDLCIPAWRLWIEMKRTEKYAVGEDQVDWHAYLRDLGDTVLLGIGCEDAKRKVLEWRAGRE